MFLMFLMESDWISQSNLGFLAAVEAPGTSRLTSSLLIWETIIREPFPL